MSYLGYPSKSSKTCFESQTKQKSKKKKPEAAPIQIQKYVNSFSLVTVTWS